MSSSPYFQMNSPFIDERSYIQQEKPQGHWTPPFFPLLSGCKIKHGHPRSTPKWCKFLKLVIYLTFDMFAATPGASDHQKKMENDENKESPRGIRPRRCCPSPRVQNILRSLKIRALTCEVEDTTSICLAERKPEVWGK